MASNTSVKNAEGVEIWYDFDSSTNTASVTYKENSYSSYNNEYTGEVVIPSTVTYEGEEYNVTSIGDEAFYYCYSLTSITLPEGVTSIGSSAFEDCYSLTSITLPKGVTEIGEWTFAHCYSLTSITLPEGVTSIGNSAFRSCTALTSITIPEGLKSIGNSAFFNCNALTSITIPEGVTTIGEDAFNLCYKLYEVYNKSDLTITAGSWNNGCVAYYAKDVYTDSEGESKLKTVGDYLFYVDGEDIELIAYTGSETSITLPSDYEGKNYNIGDYAFYKCDALTSITIPEGVTEIGDYAFYDCNSLTSITSKNATPPTIESFTTFYDVDNSIPVYVPKSSVDAYKSAKYWKNFTNIVGAYFVDVIAENGTVEGAGAYEENAEATLTATPTEGYKFVQWSDGVTDNPRTVVVVSDTTFTAEFEIDDSPISDIQTSDVNVRLIGNNIVVEGADDYTVYSISGQNLGKVESVERGIYIVVVNGKSYKIVAK